MPLSLSLVLCLILFISLSLSSGPSFRKPIFSNYPLCVSLVVVLAVSSHCNLLSIISCLYLYSKVSLVVEPSFRKGSIFNKCLMFIQCSCVLQHWELGQRKPGNLLSGPLYHFTDPHTDCRSRCGSWSTRPILSFPSWNTTRFRMWRADYCWSLLVSRCLFFSLIVRWFFLSQCRWTGAVKM